MQPQVERERKLVEARLEADRLRVELAKAQHKCAQLEIELAATKGMMGGPSR